MKLEQPERHQLLTDLKSCTQQRDVQWGRTIHAQAVHSRKNVDIYVVNALMDMYSKCSSMEEARSLFNDTHKPDVVQWNTLLLGYEANGKATITLDLFSTMQNRGYSPDSVTYIAVIKACRETKSLELGRQIHSQISCPLTRHLENTLIDMYSNCGSMIDAHEVFDSLQKPDTVSWNALLMGYAENGQGNVALDLFVKMKADGYKPNSVTYVAAVKACTTLTKEGCLERGKELYSESGCHSNLYLQNTFIDMFAKCGRMVKAQELFDAIEKPNEVSFNALLSGYVDNGEPRVALQLFSRMKERGYIPDSVTYIAILKACASVATAGDESGLEHGRLIHSEIGCHSINPNLLNTLVDMYSKCGSMVDAHLVFDSLQTPNVVSWTALLSGYVDNGEAHTSLNLFARMKAAGCAPNSVTYIAVLRACGMVGALTIGRKVHSEINEYTTPIVTCLVNFYAKCGSMVDAHDVFTLHSRARDIATWNVLIAGYGRFGMTGWAFKLFQGLQDDGLRPDAFTFMSLLICCSHAGVMENAIEFFEAMPKQYGITPTIMHYNCMIDVLGRGNHLEEAKGMMKKMPYTPNAVTWTTLLGACRNLKNVEVGGKLSRLQYISQN